MLRAIGGQSGGATLHEKEHINSAHCKHTALRFDTLKTHCKQTQTHCKHTANTHCKHKLQTHCKHSEALWKHTATHCRHIANTLPRFKHTTNEEQTEGRGAE